MKLTLQGPYALGAVIGWPIIGVATWLICGDAGIGVFAAFIGSFIIWMIGRDKMQNYEAMLQDPPAKLFEASDFDVQACIKEVMQNNIGDKWWINKRFDEAPDEEGIYHARYIMTYKEEFKSDPPQLLDRQLILEVKIQKVASQTSVELDYQVASEKIRWTANEILENTTAMIWTRLDRLQANKAPKKEI